MYICTYIGSPGLPEPVEPGPSQLGTFKCTYSIIIILNVTTALTKYVHKPHLVNTYISVASSVVLVNQN